MTGIWIQPVNPRSILAFSGCCSIFYCMYAAGVDTRSGWVRFTFDRSHAQVDDANCSCIWSSAEIFRRSRCAPGKGKTPRAWGPSRFPQLFLRSVIAPSPAPFPFL